MYALSATKSNTCTICKKIDLHCKRIAINSFYGCYFCYECQHSGALKQAILNDIETQDKIPCMWMISKKFTFFRASAKQMQTDAELFYGSTPFDMLIAKSPCDDLKTDYTIMMQFGEPSEKGHRAKRGVSFGNLIRNDPDFYDGLITCPNIFGSNPDISISFAELPKSIRFNIYAAKTHVDQRDPSSFQT